MRPPVTDIEMPNIMSMGAAHVTYPTLRSPPKSPTRAASPSKLDRSPTTLGKVDRSPTALGKPPALPVVRHASSPPPLPQPAAKAAARPATAAALAVRFVLGLGEGGCAPESTVVLKGSWDSWGREVPLRFNPAAGAFEASVPLAPAVYQYKFVVDGRWTTQPSRPEVQDGAGNTNNEMCLV